MSVRSLFTAIALSLSTFATSAAETHFSGHLNTWSLYETDDITSTTVAMVYDSVRNALLGVAVGPDISRECALPNRRCEYRKIGQDYELTLERISDSGQQKIGEIGGDTLLSNLGIDAKFDQERWSGKMNGNFTASLLNDRALYGSKKYRPSFMDTYVQYANNRQRFTFGRKSIASGVLVDGVTADFLFGPESSKDAKTFGLFAGFSPDPMTKLPGIDSVAFGPTYRFIPDFSSSTDTKLILEGSLVTDLYEGQINRFYLFTRAHFTPVRNLSILGLSTLELPGLGATDTGFKSSQFFLQTFLRPSPQWFASVSFSQFRIDRFMEPEAVRWVTDDKTQSLRISDSLDRSQRYRFETRVSYRPVQRVQPYFRIRYERRTFDSNKTNANAPPTATSPAGKELAVLDRKDAYRGTLGLRMYFFDEKLETESTATYNQRFQSKAYDFYQSFTWDSGTNWTTDLYLQWVSSQRNIQNSIPSTPSQASKTIDYYAGIGGSYRFLSDFLAQIRYDFSNEEDLSLADRITSHSILGRLDYSF
jgi:hypothetical protein